MLFSKKVEPQSVRKKDERVYLTNLYIKKGFLTFRLKETERSRGRGVQRSLVPFYKRQYSEGKGGPATGGDAV